MPAAQPAFALFDPPEFRFLCDCLASPSPDGRLLAHQASDFDWGLFLNLCRRHSVRPLVYRALSLADWQGVPSHIQHTFQQFIAQNSRRNSLLSLELVRIITKLNDSSIPSSTFKGPTLAQSVYGNVGLREFLDLDLIVRPVDVPQVRRILSADGYETKHFDRNTDDYREESGQATFVRPNAGWGLDLHWKLAPFGMRFPFSEGEIWRSLQPLPLANGNVPCLAWDQMALFLAFHGAKERWRSLKWICDFAALAHTRTELDWESLHRRAAANHCSRALLVAARLCESLSLSAPPVLLDKGRNDARVQSIVDRILRRLAFPVPETDLSMFSDSLATTERVRDKIQLTLTLFTTLTASDYAAVRLPAPLHGIYYLMRPFRLAAKAASLLCQRFRSAR